MDAKKAVEKVEKSKEYKEFKAENPDYYLASCFDMGDGWTIGYYSIKTDEIITFDADPIKQNPPDHVFKKEDVLKELDLSKVKFPFDKAKKMASDLHKKKYSAHKVNKTIVILQDHGQLMYNITMITSSFNVINIKIDAISGKLISESITSALAFKEK